jgi:hypothetical protein
MMAAFLKDFFDDFFDGLYFFLFFTIFGFENHQVLLFKKVRKMVGLKLMFIFQDLLANFRRHFEGKAVHVLDIVSGPFIGSCLNLNDSIDLVREEGPLEINSIVNTRVTFNVRIIGFVFHSGALVVAPSIAPGTFPHIISWFGFKTS